MDIFKALVSRGLKWVISSKKNFLLTTQIIALIGFILLIPASMTNFSLFFPITLIIIGLLPSLLSYSLTSYYDKEEKKKEQKEEKKNKELASQKLQEVYINRLKKEEAIPKNAKKMVAMKIKDKKTPIETYIWLNEGILHIVTDDYSKAWRVHLNLKLDQIQYFFNSGDFYTETKISGGGGGGSSLTGAVVGGVLFGGVGAIIGSRKKIDPITSELLVHDTRETILKYTDESEEHFIHFKLDTSKILHGLIPQKSFDVVMSNAQDQNEKIR